MGKNDQEHIEDEKSDEGDAGGKGKKKFSLKLIVLIAGILVLAGGGIFLQRSGKLPFLPSSGKQAHAGKKEVKEETAEIGPIRPLDTFIVNLADPLGKRYLKIRPELELDSEKLSPEMEKRLPQLRDTIITLLGSKNYEDINSMEEKIQLRAELMMMLNQHLKTGKIRNIYFSEFIVQ